jgi:ABC-type multidrug transport system permease subunit
MSPRLTAFAAMCVARFKEFVRESEVIFWSFVFPVILSVGLGLAFRNRPPETLAVAVVEASDGAAGRALEHAPLLRVSRLDREAAARALRLGQVALVVDATMAGRVDYSLDPSRSEALLARARVDDALQRAAGRSDPLSTRETAVSEPGARYIDFLIPGILGMNLMSGAMWGVGFNLVDMRIKKLLKRLLATPMRRADFLAAQMTVRLAFMLIEVTFVLGFGRLAFGVPIRGSLGAILAVGAVGALSFAGLGLLVGARPRRIEGVMGLMNVVMMPMFVCSGIFFSAERFPAVLQPLIRALPLTALINALRALVLEGATLASQGPRLLLLAAWGIVSFVLGLRLFRWN